MFKETGDNLRINTLHSKPAIRVLREDKLGKTIEINHEIEIPESASSAFAEEKRRLVWHPDRQSERSENFTTFKITTELTLNKHDKQLTIRVKLNNNVDDHRLRVLFPTGKQTETHQVGSVFEVVTRANKQVKEWTNPAKDNRKQGFVASGNIVVASVGLPEYEVSEHGDKLELTLLRAVSEIGDWGDFPAYEAECHREITAEFHVFLTDDSDVANSTIPAQVNACLTPIFAFQHKSATKENILAEKEILQNGKQRLDLSSQHLNSLKTTNRLSDSSKPQVNQNSYRRCNRGRNRLFWKKRREMPRNNLPLVQTKSSL